MKRIIIVFSLFLTMLSIRAQDNDLPPFLVVDTADIIQTENIKQDVPFKKIDFQLETGFSIGTFGKGASFTSSYVLPTAQFNVNPRLSFSVGALISDNKWIGNSDIKSGSLMDYGSGYPSLNTGIIMAEGQYEISPWLSVNGRFMNNVAGNNDLYNAYSNINNMMGIGVDFNITPNIRIGAQMYMVEYQNNPFYTPYQVRSPYNLGW